MLEIDAVTKRFGGLVAVGDVSLTVNECEIVGLIGPNGAGKTTLYNVIAGAFRPTEGQVRFCGTRIEGKRADKTCALGLARTFQIPQVFSSMTAGESILVAAFLRRRARSTAFRIAHEIAKAVNLDHRFEIPVLSLTTVERKRLEVARALATEPKMILLDEVMAGLNYTEVSLMLDLVSKLRNDGLTILFVEHNLSAVMQVCDRIAVLDSGRKIADGLPDEVMENPQVVAAYLGTPATEVGDAEAENKDA